MTENDIELIHEVRGITDYGSEILLDEELETIVGIGKAELRADLGNQALEFYTSETHNATRALFWFTCIGAKIKVGELQGMQITIGDIEANAPSGTGDDYWFNQFEQKRAAAANDMSPGPSVSNMTRANRTYGDNS